MRRYILGCVTRHAGVPRSHTQHMIELVNGMVPAIAVHAPALCGVDPGPPMGHQSGWHSLSATLHPNDTQCEDCLRVALQFALDDRMSLNGHILSLQVAIARARRSRTLDAAPNALDSSRYAETL